MTPLFWILWAAGLSIATFAGVYIARKHRDNGYMVFTIMLAMYVIGANVFVPRLIPLKLFRWEFIVVTGAIIWPFVSQITDMINEIYGRKRTYLAAGLAYIGNLMFVIFALMAFQTPSLYPPAQEEWFHQYFGMAGRVLIASALAYIADNFIDITIYALMKKWSYDKEQSTGKMMLYSSLRSAFSDGLTEIVDCLVFYTIAFYGLIPNDVLVTLIFSSMAAKIILSQIDLPFYWVFKLGTKGVQRDL
jgi:hypothetical protein